MTHPEYLAVHIASVTPSEPARPSGVNWYAVVGILAVAASWGAVIGWFL